MILIKRVYRFVQSPSFLAGFAVIVILGILALTYMSVPPSSYPQNKTIITIKEGSTLSEAAVTLQEHDIIKSAFIYKVFVVLLGGKHKVIAGDYLFEHPQTALRIAFRTVRGIQDIRQIKVTFPEGIATPDIARLLAKNMPGFDSATFLKLAKPLEGTLFPDTYYFYENMSPQQIIDLMHANYEKKIRTVLLDVQQFGRSVDDVIKMASLVEKESASSTDRRIIAGILWNRLDRKQLLQVDTPFFYTLGKDSSEITRSDLASDSPYNLYKHLGLPPTAIGNPGLDAILDTVHPTETTYVFYLSDTKGMMHYAETYEGHLANKQKYIQ